MLRKGSAQRIVTNRAGRANRDGPCSGSGTAAAGTSSLRSCSAYGLRVVAPVRPFGSPSPLRGAAACCARPVGRRAAGLRAVLLGLRGGLPRAALLRCAAPGFGPAGLARFRSLPPCAALLSVVPPLALGGSVGRPGAARLWLLRPLGRFRRSAFVPSAPLRPAARLCCFLGCGVLPASPPPLPPRWGSRGARGLRPWGLPPPRFALPLLSGVLPLPFPPLSHCPPRFKASLRLSALAASRSAPMRCSFGLDPLRAFFVRRA